MTFNELTSEWLNTWCDGLAYLTTKSYKNYCEHLVHMFECFGYFSLGIDELRPYHIQKIINALSKTYAPSTVVKYKAILHSIFKCAMRWEILEKNIVELCVIPRHDETEVKKSWTADEANTFVYWLMHDCDGIITDQQEQMFILLALCTGARRGELVALRDVDVGYNYIDIHASAYRGENGQTLKQPKSKHGVRRVSVPPKVISMLNKVTSRRDMLNGWITPYVFTQRSCPRQMSVDSPSHFFKRIQRLSPVPRITLHGLRHTHASLLIEAGIDVATVSARLGHSKKSVTLDIYTHAGINQDNSAAASIGHILGI